MNTTPIGSTPPMTSRKVMRRIRLAGRLLRAFTLIEMLICVGAVSLIAIGLGKLFASTGDTVKIGKRVSYLSEAAATLERQIRTDLASATRDGFLVIRNKLITDPTTTNNGVLLSADDRNPNPRKRRADELVFFANGKFTSKREPQWPGRFPQGSAARIYYGHGMRASDYGIVHLDSDPNFKPLTGITWPPGLGQSGPNQYASDWILLRHVTTLARPQETDTKDPSTYGQQVPTYLTGARWADKTTQNGLQPAATSIFRFSPPHPGQPDLTGWGYEERTGPTTTTTVPPAPIDPGTLARLNESAVWPAYAGGMVDVASIDLPTIRTRVLNVPFGLPVSTGNRNLPPKMSITRPIPMALHNTNYTNPLSPNTYNSLHMMKMMMASALPGNDPWIFDGGIAQPDVPQGGQGEQRMLCATEPPDFTGNLTTGMPYNKDEPYHQQDQAMLAASNLVVGCSEFIVEWSFGDVFPSNPAGGTDARVGSLIWHGYPRPDAGVGPYRGVGFISTGPFSGNGFDAVSQTWTNKDGTTGGRTVIPELIHWPANVASTAGVLADESVPLYSFFGFLDPTLDNTFPAAQPNLVDTIPWVWPKFLRFTVTLTDPNDPTVEQTFQFVVDMPNARQVQ